MLNRIGGLFLLINVFRFGNSRNGFVVNINPANGRVLTYAKVYGFRVHPPRRSRR